LIANDSLQSANQHEYRMMELQLIDFRLVQSL